MPDARLFVVVPSSCHSTLYPDTKASPAPEGGSHVTVSVRSPSTALTTLGELGTDRTGVPSTTDDDEPSPASLTANTRTLYVVPFFRTRKVWGDAAEVALSASLQFSSLSLRSKRYRTIREPPSLAGASQLTSSVLSPGLTPTVRGAPGTVNGVPSTSSEGSPSP